MTRKYSRWGVIGLALLGVGGPAMGVEIGVRQITDADKRAIAAVMREKLNDGFSAHYRWPAKTSEGGIYCVWVNSKNGFGAYSGFTPYTVLLVSIKGNESFAELLHREDEDPAFTLNYCIEHGIDMDGATEGLVPALSASSKTKTKRR